MRVEKNLVLEYVSYIVYKEIEKILELKIFNEVKSRLPPFHMYLFQNLHTYFKTFILTYFKNFMLFQKLQQQPQYMMQQQQQQQQQLHQQQQQQHGGGPGQGPVPHYVDDLAPQPVVRMRGGWGPFIGLKGGRPMDSNPPSSTSSGPPGAPPGGMQMPMAVVTTAPLMNNVPRPQGQQQGGPQQVKK